MDLKALQANYQPIDIRGSAPAPKKGRSGFSKWLPTILGAGATIAAAPFTGGASLAGTAAILGGAAAAGGAAGEFGAQKLNKEKTDFGKIAKEGAISGATGAIPLGGVAKTAKVARTAEQGAEKIAPTSLLGRVKNNVQTSAKNTDMEASGLKVGQALRGGETLVPERANELYDFARNASNKYVKGGVKAGKPIDQATNTQEVHNGVIKALDESLGKINRNVTPKEVDNLTKSLNQKLIDHPDITGKTALADKFKELVAKKDVVGLEKLRREYDDIAYTAAGKAGNTSKAAEAKALRDTIDEFVTPLSKDYKGIKGDYSNSKELLTLSSKGSAGAKGAPVPFLNARVLPQSTAGLKSKVANKIAGIDTSIPERGLLSRVAREGVKQTIGQTVGGESPIALTPSGSSEVDYAADPNSPIPDTSTNGTPPVDDTQNQLNSAIQEALAKGDTKGLDNLLKVASYYADQQKASGGKALGATQQQQASNAETGLQSIQDLSSLISSNRGLVDKSGIPGQSSLLGGFESKLLGTGSYNAAATNIKDVISRLRSGAALTEQEEKRYTSLIPKAGDDDQTITYKLNSLQSLFNKFANPTAATDNVLTSSGVQ